MPWQVAGYETDADKPFDQGSFGTVWHARRMSDGRRVALKLVLRDHSPDAAERIEAERRGAMLQRSFHDAHGMVPEVYDVGYDKDGDLFIAMELVAGVAVSELTAAGPLYPRAAAMHAMAICAFLEKAHSFSTTIEGDHYDRLVHADLKPGHIFVRDTGAVTVLDFGIAKALDKSKPLTTNNWGTSAYMSPERLLDGRVDEQVDYWSVGIMLYEMLAGHRPYRALHAPAQKSQLERAIRGNAPREPLPASVPPALAAIVNKLLAYQLERRYPSAAAIRADLGRYVATGVSMALGEYDTPATARVRGVGSDGLSPSPSPAAPPTTPFTGAVPPTDPWPPSADAGDASGGPPPLPAIVLPGVPPPLPPPLPQASTLSVPAPDTLAPGDLRPAAATNAGAAPASQPGAPSAQATPRPARRPPRLRRLARAVALVVLAILALGELSAWIDAEQFRTAIGRIDGASLAAAEASYARLEDAGTLGLGLHLRVHRPLQAHLLALGARVIDDYRSDQPSLVLADWKQAEQALRWAERIGGSDQARARRLLCEAHVLRIATRPGRADASQAAYRRAIERFRAAARLDPESFDPYLGISRTAIYGLVPADVDLAAEALRDAVQRGYRPGRRERAQLADGYMRRAETLRREARSLSGDDRARALEKARDDFDRCIETFEPLIGFGQSARNLETCKANRARIDDEIIAAIDKAGA